MIEKERILHLFKKRIDNNQNVLIAFIGGTGTGKSYSAIGLAEELDPTFNIDNVVYTATELVDKVQNDKKLHIGSVLIFDEAGVGMATREWYKLQNKTLSFLLQTFRYKQFIVIFTTPDLEFIDKHARKLFNFIIETKKISRKKNLCKATISMLLTDKRKGKIYYVNPRYRMKLEDCSEIVMLSYIHFKLPSRALIEKYELKKRAFAGKIGLELMEMDKKKGEILSANQKIVYTLLKVGMTPAQIAKNIDKTSDNVRNIIFQIKEKGLDLPKSAGEVNATAE